MVFAVAVVFAVGFVVFVAVADEIAQGKAVVRGDEVDGAGRAAPVVAEYVVAAADALGKRPQPAVFPQPEATHIVAEAAIPFGEARRVLAEVVAVRADVPRFGNHFDARQFRVLLDGGEESGTGVE